MRGFGRLELCIHLLVGIVRS
ncbi:hypothetical protein BCEP4_1020030 [Burkholderia cepacia]|nr:hypothetical protein BCEP4_1020030 [Burkholderia cepacia]